MLLVVEDDPAIAELLQATLQREYVVFVARNVKVVRKVMENVVIEVILLDWRLGHECGQDVLDALPRKEGKADPPTIVMSGDTSEEAAMNSGATGVLHKPFSVLQLLTTLANALKSQNSRDGARPDQGGK
jgi:DNA-binding response OmpR family regulator